MEDRKPMATPMITNLKKVTTSNSELVDPMLYMQLNVFSQHQTRYTFCTEHLESSHNGAEAGVLGCNKTCAQIFEVYSGVWFEIS
jgi:hypothetical protein